jgi:hypothetical protein
MNNSSTDEARLDIIGRITSYGPLVATIAILLVQTFFPSRLEALPLTATLAILTASVVFLVWHVETTLIASKRSLTDLALRMNQLESTQFAFIVATTCMSQLRLGAAFAVIAAKTPRVGHLRIYAISSQQILSFLKFNDIMVEKCQILLRTFESNDAPHKDFLNQIRLVVADWHYLHKSGRIAELEIRHYDFFPTEYECIFDRDHLILGLYDSDPEDYSEVRVRDPILIRGTSDTGRIVISEFADRFDQLFEICAVHHGPNTI